MCQESKLVASWLHFTTTLHCTLSTEQKPVGLHVSQFTLVVVLTPHEDAAPMRQVIRDDREPVPPRLHYSLHVVEAGVAAQVGRLKAHVDLSGLLQLNNLLGSLCERDRRMDRWNHNCGHRTSHSSNQSINKYIIIINWLPQFRLVMIPK